MLAVTFLTTAYQVCSPLAMHLYGMMRIVTRSGYILPALDWSKLLMQDGTVNLCQSDGCFSAQRVFEFLDTAGCKSSATADLVTVHPISAQVYCQRRHGCWSPTSCNTCLKQTKSYTLSLAAW